MIYYRNTPEFDEHFSMDRAVRDADGNIIGVEVPAPPPLSTAQQFIAEHAPRLEYLNPTHPAIGNTEYILGTVPWRNSTGDYPVVPQEKIDGYLEAYKQFLENSSTEDGRNRYAPAVDKLSREIMEQSGIGVAWQPIDLEAFKPPKRQGGLGGFLDAIVPALPSIGLGVITAGASLPASLAINAGVGYATGGTKGALQGVLGGALGNMVSGVVGQPFAAMTSSPVAGAIASGATTGLITNGPKGMLAGGFSGGLGQALGSFLGSVGQSSTSTKTTTNSTTPPPAPTGASKMGLFDGFSDYFSNLSSSFNDTSSGNSSSKPGLTMEEMNNWFDTPDPADRPGASLTDWWDSIFSPDPTTSPTTTPPVLPAPNDSSTGIFTALGKGLGGSLGNALGNLFAPEPDSPDIKGSSFWPSLMQLAGSTLTNKLLEHNLPDRPNYPDPLQVARTQADLNKEAALYNANLGRFGYNMPGMQGFWSGAVDDPNKTWNVTLDPALAAQQQAQWTFGRDLQQGVANLYNQAMAQGLFDVFHLPDNLPRSNLDFSGLPALAGYDETARQRAEDAVFNNYKRLLDPQRNNELTDLHTRLANQGIGLGSDAWNREMNTFNTRWDDQYNAARNNAIATGGNELQRAFNNSLQARSQMGNEALNMATWQNQARAQALQEALMPRAQTLGDLRTLQSLVPGLGTPSMPTWGRGTMAAADYSNLTGGAYNAAMANYKNDLTESLQKNQMYSDLAGGALGGLGSILFNTKPTQGSQTGYGVNSGLGGWVGSTF
ncbi:MAG: hypothetical protein HQL56_12085 [Magnetococcales bacterium]|nr:hypothetical protein [Magnetococcales bacterium]